MGRNSLAKLAHHAQTRVVGRFCDSRRAANAVTFHEAA